MWFDLMLILLAIFPWMNGARPISRESGRLRPRADQARFTRSRAVL